jgi:hypothetical protein
MENQSENKENETQEDINQSNMEPNGKDCKLFKSTKGQFKLSLDGFTYEKSRNVEQKYYWTCEERKKEPYHCKARAITKLIGPSNHRYINSSNDSEHNHEPKAIRIGVATVLSVMKDKAKDLARTKNCQIIEDTIGESSAIVARNLPSKNALVQAVQRAKKKVSDGKEPLNMDFTMDRTFLIETEDSMYVVKDISFQERF